MNDDPLFSDEESGDAARGCLISIIIVLAALGLWLAWTYFVTFSIPETTPP